ncbi:hypothetical protein AB1Y57_28235 [Citrobacter freundii]
MVFSCRLQYASKKLWLVAAAAGEMLAKTGIEDGRQAQNCWHSGSGRDGGRQTGEQCAACPCMRVAHGGAERDEHRAP